MNFWFDIIVDVILIGLFALVFVVVNGTKEKSGR